MSDSKVQLSPDEEKILNSHIERASEEIARARMAQSPNIRGLAQQYVKDLRSARGNKLAIRQIRDRYRAAGLDPSAVVIGPLGYSSVKRDYEGAERFDELD